MVWGIGQYGCRYAWPWVTVIRPPLLQRRERCSRALIEDLVTHAALPP
jgi:hypothetical protein